MEFSFNSQSKQDEQRRKQGNLVTATGPSNALRKNPLLSS